MLLIRLLMLLIAGALIAWGVLLLYAKEDAMMSFFVAYFSSLVVLLASFRNYQNMVQRGVAAKSVQAVDRDITEKIDDPYALYSEEEGEYDTKTPLKVIIKEEKRLLKKERGSYKEIAKNTLYAFRFSRLLSYLVVVIGFFYLLKNKMLVLSYYLSALVIPFFIVVLYLFIIGVKAKEEGEN